MCLDIVEHLDDDMAFLKGVRRLLRPGGWLALSTHNSRSLTHVIGLAMSALRGRTLARLGSDTPPVLRRAVAASEALERRVRAGSLHGHVLSAVSSARALRELAVGARRLRGRGTGGLPRGPSARVCRQLPFEKLCGARPMNTLGWGTSSSHAASTDVISEPYPHGIEGCTHRADRGRRSRRLARRRCAAAASRVSEVVVFDNFVRGHAREPGRGRPRPARPRSSKGRSTDASCRRAGCSRAWTDVFLLASLWLGECLNDPRSAWEVCTLGTWNVVEACLKHGVRAHRVFVVGVGLRQRDRPCR